MSIPKVRKRRAPSTVTRPKPPPDVLLSMSVPGLVAGKMHARAVRILLPAGEVSVKSGLQWNSASVGDQVAAYFGLPRWPGFDGFQLGHGPPGPKANSKIVTRVVRIIMPPADQEVACRDHAAFIIGWGCLLYQMHSNWVWTKETSKLVSGAIQQLEKAVDSISGLPRWIKRKHRKTIGAFVQRLAQTKAAFKDDVDQHGLATRTGRHQDLTKLNIAQHAYDLLEEYASKKPNLTVEGPFYQLASVLYEAATGEQESDLQRPCRRIWGDIRAQSPS